MEHKHIKKIISDSFRENASNADAWLSNSEMNKRAAEILYDKYENACKQHSAMAPILHQLNIEGGEMENLARDLTLYKHVLMFYGLTLELALKAYLIKIGKFNPIKAKNKGSETDKISLSDEITNYDLSYYYKLVFNAKPSQEEEKHLKNLTRAIKFGKYYFEKKPPEEFYENDDFESKISFAKSTFEKIKILYKQSG